MKPIDRAFLQDFVQFGSLNHTVTAIALYNGAARAGDTATELRMHVEQLPAPDARARARDLNDASRVQKILFAKLMVEYTATMEELGALGEAIQSRAESPDIFTRFMGSHVEQVAAFYDTVLADDTADLGVLLNLPGVDDLRSRLGEADIAGIQHDYRAYPVELRKLAVVYRNTAREQVEQPTAQDLPGDWADSVNIIVGSPGRAHAVATDARGLFVQAGNKIKHRFAVVERLDHPGESSHIPGRTTIPSVRRSCSRTLLPAHR